MARKETVKYKPKDAHRVKLAIESESRTRHWRIPSQRGVNCGRRRHPKVR